MTTGAHKFAYTKVTLLQSTSWQQSFEKGSGHSSWFFKRQ